MFRYFPYTLSFCCNFSCCTFSVLHCFHIAQFSCLTSFVLSSFSVAFSLCCTFSVSHSFHFYTVRYFCHFSCFLRATLFYVSLFSCCTFFMFCYFLVTLFCVAFFSCYTLFMLLFSRAALFLCCFFVLHTRLMLHFFRVALFSCCTDFAILGPNCILIPRICPNFQKLLK